MKILMPLAEGFEEIETVTIVDILRRGGIDVTLARFNSYVVTGAHGIKIVADKRLDKLDYDSYDAIILHGGNPGYINLSKSNEILKILKKFNSENKLIGAICGGPYVLEKADIIYNKKATIYPGMEKHIPRPSKGKVVVDKNIITTQSPGTAILFALKILEKIKGEKISEKVKKDLVL